MESLIVVTRAPGKFGDYALGAHTVPTNSESFREREESEVDDPSYKDENDEKENSADEEDDEDEDGLEGGVS